MDEKELTVMKYTAEGLQKPMKRRMRKRNTHLRLFASLPGLRASASNSGMAALRELHRPQGVKRLVGALPKQTAETPVVRVRFRFVRECA